jgi:hypothetical protein
LLGPCAAVVRDQVFWFVPSLGEGKYAKSRKVKSRHVLTSESVSEYIITARIVVGGLLMLVGGIYAVLLSQGGPEQPSAIWPLYLGGVVAIVLGWINGDLRS